jgi:ankyrin repeat protein
LSSATTKMGSPAAWLRERGFDPERDLAKAIPSKRDKDAISTAMYEAALEGDLGMCRFLWEHGARETIRTKNNFGLTPMIAACFQAHLHVAQWLFEVGAAADIRTKNNFGCTPMFIACFNGNLIVAQWLFEVGAADDIRTKNNDGDTPMFAAYL